MVQSNFSKKWRMKQHQSFLYEPLLEPSMVISSDALIRKGENKRVSVNRKVPSPYKRVSVNRKVPSPYKRNTRVKKDFLDVYPHSVDAIFKNRNIGGYKRKSDKRPSSQFRNDGWGNILASNQKGNAQLKYMCRGSMQPSSSSIQDNKPSQNNLDNYSCSNKYIPVFLSSEAAGIRYSIRSNIGDGLDQGCLTEKFIKLSDRQLKPNNCHLNTSYCTTQNRRQYMEDRIVIDTLGSLNSRYLNQKNSLDHQHSKSETHSNIPLSLFAVFDGHGGSDASQYCCDWISSYLKYQIFLDHNLSSAMKSTFSKIDMDFVRTGLSSGTTACVCVISSKNQIICANAGDSRAILIKADRSIVKLSSDHKPGTKSETKRIIDLGGKITHSGTWRVQGRLSVSRSIGDTALKPFVTSDPDICVYTLNDDDRYAVIASDGIWDVLSNELVSNIVSSYLNSEKENMGRVYKQKLRLVAKQVCTCALADGSHDNLSCIVIDLHARNKGMVSNVPGRFEI